MTDLPADDNLTTIRYLINIVVHAAFNRAGRVCARLTPGGKSRAGERYEHEYQRRERCG